MIDMAQISLRIDDEVKRSAEKTLDSIGLSMSVDPFYSKENTALLEQRVMDIRFGKSILKEHELIEE